MVTQQRGCVFPPWISLSYEYTGLERGSDSPEVTEACPELGFVLTTLTWAHSLLEVKAVALPRMSREAQRGVWLAHGHTAA